MMSQIFNQTQGPNKTDHRPIGPAVPAASVGQRVDLYLSLHYPFLSRAGWQKRIMSGKLLVNHRVVKPSFTLGLGDTMQLYAPPIAEPPVDRGVRVLWEDQGVMAVFKPAHLPMHENGPYRKNTLTQIIWDTCGKDWAAVHRLDRETSGIVLCGGTPLTRSRLAQDFEGRRIVKEYLAIGRGLPTQPKWMVDGPIGDLRESEIRIKKWVVADGLPAETQFEVEDRASYACLLRVKPKTGRTNQIRIHAAWSGHGLYGDKLYHPDEAVFLEFFAQGPTESVIKKTGFHRVCLHAASLEFVHPVSLKTCRIESPLPPDLAAFWQQLKGH